MRARDDKMKWLKNYETVVSAKQAGECPFCKSVNTDYTIRETSKKFGYCIIGCNDFKHGCHISRMAVNPDDVREAAVPTGLKYYV